MDGDCGGKNFVLQENLLVRTICEDGPSQICKIYAILFIITSVTALIWMRVTVVIFEPATMPELSTTMDDSCEKKRRMETVLPTLLFEIPTVQVSG
ncbi:hypothetical protein KIN20_008122 [Parelaphostrongylus tenuis]|uniref:Uncharacterized protein n=1 Tax=Parelaphostrongylus tenuis TaxID=148309 RepID=A0AAD5QH98_PARTN|nr:hypothetical protein KIN20_008122 [Parelaphostrongylus tenuis]